MRKMWQLTFVACVIACTGVAMTATQASGAVVVLPASETAVLQNPELLSERRLLMRFDLPEYLSEGVIEIAVLELQTAVSSPDSSESAMLDCFPVTSDWSAESVDWSQGWDTAGGDLDARCHSASTADVGGLWTVRFDVTSIVEDWVTQLADNHGMIVAASLGESGILQAAQEWRDPNSRSPHLRVWYTPRADG